VISHHFEHVAPPDAAGCVAALTTQGARVLAGGTWVVPEMGRADSRPAVLVDLRRAGLGGVTTTADGLRIGATSTYADLLASPDVARHAPLLQTMAAGITGGWALRCQGTIGGSAAAARPQSDVPAALVALGATARVAGPDGMRRLPVQQLFAGAMRTTLGPGELLLGFDLPSASSAGHGYAKVKRGGSSWPIATAAALLRLGPDGVCTGAVLVLGAVSAVPLEVDVARVLVGRVPDDDAVAAAARLGAAAVQEPWSDELAPAGYRAAIARPVAHRALTAALRTAIGASRHEQTEEGPRWTSP
jgi:carbon-monoxide dehydrogenase medium subunit